MLNIGYENDPVFRVLTGHSLTLDSLFNHDTPLETCTNNIVSFNDYYAGLTNDCKIFSIANMASGPGTPVRAIRMVHYELWILKSMILPIKIPISLFLIFLKHTVPRPGFGSQ